MAEVINELSLMHVKYKEGRLFAAWELNGGNIDSYAKIEYAYEITKDGKKEAAGEFTDETGEASSEIIWKAGDGASYEFRLYVKKQPNASDERELVIGRFTGLAGSFDGERFAFSWDLAGGMVSDGYFKVLQKDAAGKELLHMPVSPMNRKYVTEPVRLAIDGPVCVIFTACDGEICEGPDSEPLYFVPMGVAVYEADWEAAEKGREKSGEKGGENAVQRLKLTIGQASDAMKTVQVILKRNGREVYRSGNLEISGSADLAEVEVDISSAQVRPDLLRQCVACCIYTNGNALSNVMSQMSQISLAKPDVIPLAVGETCRAAVQIRSEIEPAGYELSGNPALVAVEGNCSPDFAARARYDSPQGIQRKGPSSGNGFPECFYADKENIYYRRGAFQAKQQQISIPSSYFQEMPQSIHAGGFSLEPPGEKQTDCTLALQAGTALAADDCRQFLKELSNAGLSAEGFYYICESILRTGDYKKEDTAFFQCRYEPESRSMDINPGLILRVETAMYIPQYDTKIKKAAGFAWMNTAENEVYFSTGCSGSTGRSGVLEWNSCASGMFRTMNEGLAAEGTKVIYAAGAADLLRANVRQPYYRILYPSVMPEPDYVTPYPSDNVIVLAADSYDKILDACEWMKDDPSAISNLQIPVILFRGRGMLTLLTQIRINQEICRIPVGSTLQQALAVRGITSLEHVRLYRRAVHGRELRVYGNLEGIFPLQGDRIEV